MGSLQGGRVIEFTGIGPGPFCGMLFADTESLMRELGYTQQEIVELEESGTVKR